MSTLSVATNSRPRQSALIYNYKRPNRGYENWFPWDDSKKNIFKNELVLSCETQKSLG